MTKERLDEELKSSYEEGDEKFSQAFAGIAEGVLPMGARVIDLSAGGMALLTQENEVVNEDDYVRLASGADPAPFELNGMKAKILRSEEMKDQGQVILHIKFLPYEQELRRDIIRVVYESEASATPKGKAKSKAKKKTKAVKKKPPVAKRKAKHKEGVEAAPQATSDAGESLQ